MPLGFIPHSWLTPTVADWPFEKTLYQPFIVLDPVIVMAKSQGDKVLFRERQA